MSIRDAVGSIGVLLMFVLLFASPLICGAVLWVILSPVGFWQIAFMVLVEIAFISILYGVIIFVIALIA